ncbi:MAG: Manganese transport system rane protein MntB [Verrucomicrobiota bacterium]|jgi:manganese/zinc/iron transport system permease protein
MNLRRPVLLLGAVVAAGLVLAAWRGGGGGGGHSISDTEVTWPTGERLWRTLTLRDYNTRVVFAGVTALGAAGGLVGTFLLLRKRSLLSDTVSHCTLPGLALAFLVAEAAGYPGKSLPVLLAGAAASALLGMGAVAWLRARSRVKDDAALAIVLSVFFGLGVALTVVIQQLPTGNAAGLKNYIYGKAAAMTQGDARLILAASLGVALVCAALFKEFRLLCFDSAYARAQGWPVLALDLVLMGLVVAVTVIGLQAVGLLLVVALLILPPAAARFWSHRLGVTLAVSTVLGAASGFAGVAGSALFPKLPAGAVIVLAAALAFAVSLALGAERGLLVRWLEQHRVSRRVERQHLLRALYEWCEGHPGGALDEAVPLAALREANHWSETRLAGLLRLGRREGLVVADEAGTSCRLTGQGRLEARRVTRNHRLWETYLLHYADVAPQHIHHNADDIEHVVEPDIVNRLEELLAGRVGGALVPAEPEGGRARGAVGS